MKPFKYVFIVMMFMSLLFTESIIAQEEEKEEFNPVYITVTTAHRSADPDIDFSDWKKVEQEYFDKVTMKNDMIIGSGVYFHYFTPDDSELKLVSVYKSWNDIEESNDITDKLIEEGWPDEEERKAYFKKKNSFYSQMHSDEIYVSLPFQIDMKTESKEPMIFYVKVNQLGDGGDGFKEYFENITQKNSYIKGYYTHRHRWGANSQDAIEAFAVESFGDIEKMFDESTRLIEEYWPDEEKRKVFFKEYGKIFSGHGDYIYSNVPELAK